MSFERVGALVLSAAALSAGMLAVVPVASADIQAYSNIGVTSYAPEHGVDCDELIAHYDRREKHSVSEQHQLAQCEKRKHGKR